MSEVNLATDELSDIKVWAKNTIDLDLTLTMKRETMVEKIKLRCKELNIDPPEVKITSAVGKKTGYITINIAKSTLPGGNEPVFVGYQGKGFYIPRGMDISVPKPVEHILGNAKQNIVTQDPETSERLEEEVLTAPYRIVSEAA